MKPTYKLFAAGAAVFIAAASGLVFTSNQTATAQANQTPLKQAIIVLRHADDPYSDQYGMSAVQYVQKDGVGLSNYWKGICPAWPRIANMASTQTVYVNGNYQTETHGSVTTFQHGLTTLGERQAERLKNALPAILDFQGMAPVKRVVTINPCPESSSPNPFDTVYPFLVGNTAFCDINKQTTTNAGGKVVPTAAACKSLLLLDNTGPKTNSVSNDLQAMLDRGGLLPTADEGGGSTILCWEGHALLKEPTHDSILRQLEGETIYASLGEEVPMGKGNTLYIFTKRENTGPGTSIPVQKYNLDIYRAITPDEPRPSDLGKFVWTRSYKVDEVPKNGVVEAFSTIHTTEPKDASLMNFSN